MAIRHDEHVKRMNLDEFLAFIETDPDHRYELVDGYPCMMTGGSPDHSIIGANINGILREHLRRRPCIVYNSAVYVALNENDDDAVCQTPPLAVIGEIVMQKR